MASFNYDYVNKGFRGKAKAYSEKVCLVQKKMKAECYKNVIVLPYDKGQKGAVITDDDFDISTDFPKKVNLSNYNMTCLEQGDKAVLIGNFWIYIWGHCFTDHFNKLWFVFTDECKKLQNEGAELIILSCQTKIPNYFKTLIELTGLDWNSIKIISNPVQYKELYVPDNCYFQQTGEWHRFYTKEYVDILERMKCNVRKIAEENGNFPQYDRIYLTRTQGSFGTFRDLGEKSVEKVFQKEGYTIVAPEKLTVPQQIWLMMNVKDLVATDGSICHASTFCQYGTKVTVLMKADFLVEHQIVSDQIANLNVTYISVHHSFFANKKTPWHGPFLLCVTNNLERYIGRRIPHLPFFFKKDFFIYCIRRVYVKTLRNSTFIDIFVKRLLGIKRSY